MNNNMKIPVTGICGAVYGDIIGLPYEFRSTRTKNYDFELKIHDFSDDTILTVAIARWMLDDDLSPTALRQKLIDYSLRFKDKNVWGRGYQEWFLSGGTTDRRGIASNGAAMRVSPIAYASDDLEEVLRLAAMSARLTHDSEEAERGAQAVAAAVFFARHGRPKDFVRQWLTDHFAYELSRTVDQIRPDYHFEILCDRCVPESIICWLDSESYEQTVRKAVSLGGDADTMAAMAGAIAAATPGMAVPSAIARPCFELLPEDFRRTLLEFGQPSLL